MSDMPEKIWVIEGNINIWMAHPYPLASDAHLTPPVTEYLRADVAQAEIERLKERNEALVDRAIRALKEEI
jgi:hypothetical protein